MIWKPWEIWPEIDYIFILSEKAAFCTFIWIPLALAPGLLAYFPLAFDVTPVGSEHHLMTSQIRPCLPHGSQADPCMQPSTLTLCALVSTLFSLTLYQIQTCLKKKPRDDDGKAPDIYKCTQLALLGRRV